MRGEYQFYGEFLTTFARGHQFKFAIQDFDITIDQQLNHATPVCVDTLLRKDRGLEGLTDDLLLRPGKHDFGVMTPAGNFSSGINPNHRAQGGVEHRVSTHLSFDQLTHGGAEEKPNRDGSGHTA